MLEAALSKKQLKRVEWGSVSLGLLDAQVTPNTLTPNPNPDPNPNPNPSPHPHQAEAVELP